MEPNLTTEQNNRVVVVIGGGASGMMAAAHAAYAGARVILIEKNERLGVKLRITGKGRCNLTNDCGREEFLQNVPENPRFLYAALARFSPADTETFFEMLGVPLKVERGKRVFPVSDRAHDVADALREHCLSLGVSVKREKAESLIFTEEKGARRIAGVKTTGGSIVADAVIVATGGCSYPRTGSDGDGYRFAKQAGHTVTPLLPSLVPLVGMGRVCKDLQGLSLKNVSLKIEDTDSRKIVFSDFGELLFTHFGMSGPLVLSASAHLSGMRPGKYRALIDLKPALDEKTLDARVLSDFGKYANRDFLNALSDLLPQKMIEPMILSAGLDPRKKVNEITKEERRRFCAMLKAFPVLIRGFRPIDEAIITRGGVSVREIDPKTMQSKLIPGLYFAGEVIDVDAYTGGFNLQIAFSTAVLAGENAGSSLHPRTGSDFVGAS